MSSDQTTPTEPARYRSASAERARERHERHMAKQQAREARRLARAQRPHRDWTFEFKAGEKVYTFAWRWGQGTPQVEVTQETQAAEPAAEPSPETSEAGE